MTYEADVMEAQIRWRRRYLKDVAEWGQWRGRPREHILPPQERDRGLWGVIRQDLLDYLAAESVRPHTSRHHLNSSWTLAANAFFPFRVCEAGYEVLASYLAAWVAPEVDRVVELDLEFQDVEPFDQASLLGESGGARGKNQTSPDVGVKVVDRAGARGLVLLEVKYKEPNFEDCSQYKGLSEDEKRIACYDLRSVISDPSNCPFAAKGRKYMEILRDSLAAGGAADRLDRCPAAKGGYQLTRQQALAEALAASGAYDFAVSAVILPAANHPLQRIDQTHLDSWGRSFDGKSKFAVLRFEDMVDHVERTSGPAWTRRWLEYMRGRYFPGQ